MQKTIDINGLINNFYQEWIKENTYPIQDTIGIDRFTARNNWQMKWNLVRDEKRVLLETEANLPVGSTKDNMYGISYFITEIGLSDL